jgi:adenylate cyclase
LSQQGERRNTTCRLRFRSRGQETVFVVKDDSALLGRAHESDLVFHDESVSRRHALVVREAGGWRIRDLGSRNGVRVNTYRVSQKSLNHGDAVDLGSVRLEIELAPGETDSKARVVFQHEPETGLRTDVIDMAELESLLGSGIGARSESDPELLALTQNPFSSERTIRPVSDPRESAALLRLVHRAAEVLISSSSLEEALHRMLSLVFENLPAERGVVCLHDEAKGSSEPRVMRTRDGSAQEPILISASIANDVIENRQALLVQDANDAERPCGTDATEVRINSAMCAPLYHQGQVGGFIYVDRQSGKEPFSASHLHTLSTLAVLSGAAVSQWNLRDSIRREREIRSRLSRYSSPAVVERVIKSASSSESGMVAEEGDVTVLFADLSGFTELAERLHASQVAQLLNHVFERLTEVVFAYDGTLDKFSGDGMMAFFGAPLPLPDHAKRAVEAALGMQDAIEELNIESLYGHKLSLRIGLNSGLVVVGDIGSPQRKDYTVIGDVVNTASRLESFVAEPGQIIVGPTTRELIRDHFQLQELEAAYLKGKTHAVQPHLVLGRLAPHEGSK